MRLRRSVALVALSAMKRASFFGKEVVWFVTFPEGRKLLTEIGPKGSGPFGFR